MSCLIRLPLNFTLLLLHTPTIVLCNVEPQQNQQGSQVREVKGTGDMLKSFFCRKLLPFLQSCSWIWKRIACDYTNAGPKIVGNPPNSVCMHHLEPPLGCNREDASVKKTYFSPRESFIELGERGSREGVMFTPMQRRDPLLVKVARQIGCFPHNNNLLCIRIVVAGNTTTCSSMLL